MSLHRTIVLLAWITICAGACDRVGTPAWQRAAIVSEEYVFDDAPFSRCHASTIAETESGLVAAWFGGSGEGQSDVGIWVSRRGGDGWSAPRQVAAGVDESGARHPCWNPVLFQPRAGPLLLFYKVGPSPKDWWGMLATSEDGGGSWSVPQRLPEGFCGPVKNKPIQLADGALLCGSSTETGRNRVHFELTPDLGRTWNRIGPVARSDEYDAIQPTILRHRDGRLQALCRSRGQRITTTWSDDEGWTWSAMEETHLPNPWSGIDAVTLADGRHLLVYNHSERSRLGRGRNFLNVAVSEDGVHWRAALVLENCVGEYSYPAVVQARDGLVHVTYTWWRLYIKHVVIDPAKLVSGDVDADCGWPG